MIRILIFAVLTVLTLVSTASAEEIGTSKRIIYIPIDSRPVNFIQPLKVAEKLGYEIIVPPRDLLGTGASPDKFGKPLELWNWLDENAGKADYAVIAADALLYGSLVGSRQHGLEVDEILARAKKFEAFREKFPRLQIYVFATIMRTPTSAGSSAEPEYYKQYGDMIYQYTALTDKSETHGLSRKEKNELNALKNGIPTEYLDDWLDRRAKNLEATKYLIDLTRNDVFEYCLIGGDDGAMFSQTHLEGRHLTEYSADLNKNLCLIMSGVDELGMLLISRAINDDAKEIPFVAVNYNVGVGPNTIPQFSNETIRESIEGAIISIGGLRVPNPKNADLVLAVNTRPNGKTLPADSKHNTRHAHTGIGPFMKMLDGFVKNEYPVGVVDISTSNGSDNALMRQLSRKNLLFKIRAYSGWNTATNSSGFLIGAGTLTKWMAENEIYDILAMRYLDDWAYQANVRTKINNGAIWTVPGDGGLWNLGTRQEGLEALTSQMLTDFAAKNIRTPKYYKLENIRAHYPWSRTFECDISFELEEN